MNAWRQIICCGSSKEKSKIFSLHLISISTSLYLSSGPSRRQRSASSPPYCLCCLAACCLWDFQLPSSNTLRDGLRLNPSTLLSSHWPLLALETLWQVRAQRSRFNTDTHLNTSLTSNLCITPVDLSSCPNLWSLSPSVGVSRRFRNRVLKLLQTCRVVLDSGGTCLLRCHPQHDWILAQSHLQEDQGGGKRTMRFPFFDPHDSCSWSNMMQTSRPPSSFLNQYFVMFQKVLITNRHLSGNTANHSVHFFTPSEQEQETQTLSCFTDRSRQKWQQWGTFNLPQSVFPLLSLHVSTTSSVSVSLSARLMLSCMVTVSTFALSLTSFQWWDTFIIQFAVHHQNTLAQPHCLLAMVASILGRAGSRNMLP